MEPSAGLKSGHLLVGFREQVSRGLHHVYNVPFAVVRQFVKFFAGRIIVQHHSLVKIAPSYPIKVVAFIVCALIAGTFVVHIPIVKVR